VKSLSVKELQQWLDEGRNIQLIDVREEDEWEICNLPQSMHIPMRMVGQIMLQLDKDVPLVLLCHHGMRSRMVANQLYAAGFAPVFNVEGGIHAWANEIDVEMNMY
jgi:adenylyltransferase/sulfurtransferase